MRRAAKQISLPSPICTLLPCHPLRPGRQSHQQPPHCSWGPFNTQMDPRYFSSSKHRLKTTTKWVLFSLCVPTEDTFPSYSPTEAKPSNFLNYPPIYLLPAPGVAKQLRVKPGHIPETLPVTAVLPLAFTTSLWLPLTHTPQL